MCGLKQKIINFSGGPSTLPEEVKRKASKAILQYPRLQQSILEISHRGSEFIDFYHELIEKFYKIQPLPPNYSLLLLPGGASLQFSAIPINLTFQGELVTYVNSGEWSKRAIKEAEKFVKVDVIDKVQVINSDFMQRYCLYQNPVYIHMTSNETIDGVEYTKIPVIQKKIPLIADMSSNFLSRAYKIQDFSLIYLSAQKNLGIPSLCLVIIKNDLFEKSKQKLENIPSILNYELQREKKSTYNTPSLFNWYLTGLMLDWMSQKGGISYFSEQRKIKSSLLYNFIDESMLFINQVDNFWRSKMNIVCDLSRPELMKHFICSAKKQGFINIQGHPSRGGLRFSCYNAMPIDSIKRLIRFMHSFEKSI